MGDIYVLQIAPMLQGELSILSTDCLSRFVRSTRASRGSANLKARVAPPIYVGSSLLLFSY